MRSWRAGVKMHWRGITGITQRRLLPPGRECGYPERSPGARLPAGAMSQDHTLLRELNHRVQNNFQIIVSLLNLKKRLLPDERCADVRFLEEHVLAMAAAYRLVHATGELIEVPIADLVGEIATGLRQLREIPADRVGIDVLALTGALDLDRAVALGLYLAAVLPHYLDRADASGPVLVTGDSSSPHALLSLRLAGGVPVPLDALSERLQSAYLMQIDGSFVATANPSERRIRFAASATC